jgi:uncharacterized protein YjbJ (UPF0337 family)
MNKDLLESKWGQIRDLLKEKFSNLTEEDMRQINGHYDQLVAKLEQKYGYTREEAEERIRSLNFDRFNTTPGSSSREAREDMVLREKEPFRREKDNDFYKWLLALGIPLLLLGSYFLSTRTPEVTRPPVAQEQTIVETPADRFISNNLRNTLLAQPNLPVAMENVQVVTHNGVVTLSGTVPSAEMRDNIVTTAQNFAGVRQVVNNIEVR